MSELQQLVYISRAAFASSRQGLGVEPEVGRILVQSRLNNPRRGLVGALYYGDGCFFQCLEGPSASIDVLYAQLLADPRHRDLKVLYRRSIGKPSFSEWAMKYVPGAREVRALLKKHGMRRFDPYRFGPEAIGDMVALLHQGINTEAAVVDRPVPARRPYLWWAAAAIVAIALGVAGVAAAGGWLPR